MTPAGVVTLTHAGHEVYIETGAGLGSSFTDADYIAQVLILFKQLKKLGPKK